MVYTFGTEEVALVQQELCLVEDCGLIPSMPLAIKACNKIQNITKPRFFSLATWWLDNWLFDFHSSMLIQVIHSLRKERKRNAPKSVVLLVEVMVQTVEGFVPLKDGHDLALDLDMTGALGCTYVDLSVMQQHI